MPTLHLDPRKHEEIDVQLLSPEPDETDLAVYRRIVCEELTAEQRARIVRPASVYPEQETVLAVHWHPEFVPMDLIRQRVQAMFPNARQRLIIPTQHNVIECNDGFAGVEVDCYSRGFNRKVQLLIHFAEERVREADVFRAMLAHTFRYRAGQLYEFIDAVIDPAHDALLTRAAAKTGASEELVTFVRMGVSRLATLLKAHEATTPRDAIKNKLIRNYFDCLRDRWSADIINHAQILLNEVKALVKAGFSLKYFYATEEVIEEVRALGGGIVIPHPEQFWPILLADYDVDGYEVWNPQSREYTEFLIEVVHRENKHRTAGRPLLIFMGDDCHMGEKTKPAAWQDTEKVNREIGYQPAWDDLSIRKALILANVDRAKVIQDYKARLKE